MVTRGGEPLKMRHVWVPDAGNVLMVGVLNLKMYALWGAPLTRANGYINFSKSMQAWGVCTSIHLIFFSLGNLLKPMGKPGNTWGHRKYSALKPPVSLRFWIFLEKTHANICKHDQAIIAPTPIAPTRIAFSWDLVWPASPYIHLASVSPNFTQLTCFTK